jgi:hypothetical protein
MEYRVVFENKSEEVVDAPFASVAAIEAGERLGLQGDRPCAVFEPDGVVTHWRVSLLTSRYVRPLVGG